MYLLDTNVFIEAKNRYYAFDIAPGFWTWLDTAHQKSLACSIEAHPSRGCRRGLNPPVSSRLLAM